MWYTMNFNYDSYIKKLGLSKRNPSLPALTEIVSTHLTKIPFENLSKIYYHSKYDMLTIPDLEMYLEGMIKYNFGGTCYTCNYYLNQLLKYLGYRVRLCGCNMNNPDVHIVNVVEIENQEYLVDAGYAAPFLEPIPLHRPDKYSIFLGADEYVIYPKDTTGRTEISMYRKGTLRHGYILKPQSRELSDFEDVIKNSFRDSAAFLNSLLLVKFGKNSGTTVHNYAVIESSGRKFIKTVLKNDDELIDAVFKYFQIPKDIAAESLKAIPEFVDAWS